ncbi:hypothetical protein V3851_08590 [Paenibacillus sp. M1]|uniref:Uncharacterized protein n=1 Tax=Paenibacillus haidiansis TaxID=1574488 RepID=A0ABU7VQ51_9BACL
MQFEWDSEPAIHNWRIEKISVEKIRIDITCYEDGIKTSPGNKEFSEECEFNQFITEVVNSLEALLKDHGIIGYRKQWYAQDFPLSSYLQLNHYLLNSCSYPTKISNPGEWIEKIETNLNDELELIKKNIL